MAAKDLSSALVKVMEVKGGDDQGHIMRVVNNAMELARKNALSPDEIDDIAKAALLHDIGKMYIPDDILHKQGMLNAEEQSLLREHTTRARDILQGLSLFSDDVIEMVVHHHERYDGKGYPDQQSGDDICLGSRIIAIADAFDGLAGEKADQGGVWLEQALQIMSEGEGTQFDPKLLKQFVALKSRERESVG